MYCKKCGSKIPEGGKYCEQCGFASGIGYADEVSKGTEKSFVNGQIGDPNNENIIINETAKNSKRYLVFIICGSIFVLLVLAAIVFILLYKKESDIHTSSKETNSSMVLSESSVEVANSIIATEKPVTTTSELFTEETTLITEVVTEDNNINNTVEIELNEKNEIDNSGHIKYPTKVDDIELDQTFLGIGGKSYVNIKYMNIKDSYGNEYLLEGNTIICMSGEYKGSEYDFLYLLDNGYYRGFKIQDMADINGSYTFTLSYNVTDSITKKNVNIDNYTFTIS